MAVDMQETMIVQFFNETDWDVRFCVAWNDGRGGIQCSEVLETVYEADFPGNQHATILRLGGLPSGTSCWAQAGVQSGTTHNSGDNFDFKPGTYARYELKIGDHGIYFNKL